MRRSTIAITAFLMALYGCAQPGPSVKPETITPSPDQRLVSAVSLIQADNISGAMRALEELTSAHLPGVSDEALFRLALLQIGPEFDSARFAKARQTLKRLIEGYPNGQWAGQARQLDRFVARGIKRNEEFNDLKRDMKKLKSLDLELDRRGLR